MGQILGTGYAAGEKTTQKTTPTAPPELKRIYGKAIEQFEPTLPAYGNILQAGVTGNRAAAVPFAGGTAAAYQPIAGTYRPQASTYRPVSGTQATYAPQQAYGAPQYRPMAGSEQSFLTGFEGSVAPALAPFEVEQARTQEEMMRRLPAGGGRDLARGRAMQEGGAQRAAVQAQAAQRDIDARNALRQRDIELRNAYARGDIEAVNALMREDVTLQNLLRQRDIDTYNQYAATDVGEANRLAQTDVSEANRLAQEDLQRLMALQVGDVQSQNEFMQNLMNYYAQIFSGYNPQNLLGQTQVASTPGQLGFPGWSYNVGG